MTDRRNGISEFMACRETITKMLEQGHTKTYIFDTLKGQGLISFNYHNFCYHCRSKIGTKTAEKEDIEQGSGTNTKPIESLQKTTPKNKTNKRKGFSFNSKPNADDLA